MKHGVLARNGQAEARAAGFAHPGGVCSPEPIEDVGRLLFGQAYPPVGDFDGDGALAADHQDPHGLSLGVFEGVDDEVADDPLDPPRLDLGMRVAARLDDDLHPVGLGERLLGIDDGVGDLPQIRLGARQRHRSGVVAGNLEKVGEHDVEVDELVVLQFGAAAQNRWEVGAPVVNELARHSDRGDRGAELVRNRRDELLLHLGHPLELGELVRKRGGHLVEGAGELGELVAALDLHACVEAALRQNARIARGLMDRPQDEAHDESGADGHEKEEHAGADGKDARDDARRVLLGLQRVCDVELVVSRAREVEARADDDSRNLVSRGGLHLDRLPVHGVVVGHRFLHIGGDARADSRGGLRGGLGDLERRRLGLLGRAHQGRSDDGSVGIVLGGDELVRDLLELARSGRVGRFDLGLGPRTCGRVLVEVGGDGPIEKLAIDLVEHDRPDEADEEDADDADARHHPGSQGGSKPLAQCAHANAEGSREPSPDAGAQSAGRAHPQMLTLGPHRPGSRRRGR